MVRCSNSLIGILNFFTLIISIAILYVGIRMQTQANDDCEQWLDLPIIILGAFLLIVSLFGLIGSCCRVRSLLWIYLFVMFLFIIFSLAFIIFTFVITSKGTGETLSIQGDKEYKIEKHSTWLQNRVNNTKTWNRIRTCMQSGKICSLHKYKYLTNFIDKFYSKKLFEVQFGCCKPPSDCNFSIHDTNTWYKPADATSNNTDCDAWSNDPNILCFNCQSCKVGFLQRLKDDLMILAIVNIIVLFFLTIVFSIGCCAFSNIRRNNWERF